MRSEYIFPKQKLPRSKKTKSWAKSVINDIIALSNTYHNGLSRKKVKMKVNYDLYNGIINESDFSYVTNPYGLDKEYPARFAHYDIISPKINLLLGEEINRPFNFRVVCTDSESTKRVEDKKKSLIFEYAMSQFQIELMAMGIEPTEEVITQFETLPDVQKYMQYDYTDIAESTAQKSLEYLVREQDMQYKFNKGWKDALIAGQEVYHVGIENGEPIVRCVNPLNFDYDKDPDLDYIEDGQWALETQWCTPSSIIDTYYDDLTEKEIRLIDELELNSNNVSAEQVGPLIESPTDLTSASKVGILPLSPDVVSENDSTRNNGYIPVTRVEWKSLRKIGFLTYIDELGEPQETIVDETYEPIDELGQKVKWTWIPEVWEGTKIGDNIFVHIGPKSVQFRPVDQPSKCKLGFVGIAYNNRNSESVSIIDSVKSHQYLYNIIMYRMELEIAKAKGKKMIMDLAMIPKSMGIDLEKWMYYFDNIGLAFINSLEEGTGRQAGQLPNFNQFTDIDMTLSQSVGQYIGILQKIEDMVGELSGVSRQRQGQINTSETVGGVERSVLQSSHITERLFYEHNEVKKRVLTSIIECSKVAWEDGKRIQYILPDFSRYFLNIESNDYINADYGVFISDSSKDNAIKQELKELSRFAMSSGLARLSDIVEIIKSDSIVDISKKIAKSEQETMQQAQEQQERELEIQDKINQDRIAFEREKLDREDRNKQLDRDNKINVAQIQALGFDTDKDRNDNNIPDVLEFEKFLHESNMDQEELRLKREDLEFKREKLKKDSELKEKALKKQNNSNKSK